MWDRGWRKHSKSVIMWDYRLDHHNAYPDYNIFRARKCKYARSQTKKLDQRLRSPSLPPTFICTSTPAPWPDNWQNISVKTTATQFLNTSKSGSILLCGKTPNNSPSQPQNGRCLCSLGSQCEKKTHQHIRSSPLNPCLLLAATWETQHSRLTLA